MNKRRKFLKNIASLPLAGTLAAGTIIPAMAETTESPDGDFGRDYFKELGLRTFINAAGTYTALTASLMHPDVMKAINYASNQFVKLEDLQDKVGERIAELLKCEAAMVTAGAASAITLGTAGVITGGDYAKIGRAHV